MWLERCFLCGTGEPEEIEVEGGNMQKKKKKISGCKLLDGQWGITECSLWLQQMLQELHQMLKVEKADLQS